MNTTRIAPQACAEPCRAPNSRPGTAHPLVPPPRSGTQSRGRPCPGRQHRPDQVDAGQGARPRKPAHEHGLGLIAGPASQGAGARPRGLERCRDPPRPRCLTAKAVRRSGRPEGKPSGRHRGHVVSRQSNDTPTPTPRVCRRRCQQRQWRSQLAEISTGTRLPPVTAPGLPSHPGEGSPIPGRDLSRGRRGDETP